MCYGTMCWSCKSCDKQIRKKGPTGAWIFATWRIVQCAFRKKSVYKLRDQVSIQINTVRSHTRVCAVIFRLPNVNGVSDFNRLLGNGWCNLNYSNGGPFWPILDKMFFFFLWGLGDGFFWRDPFKGKSNSKNNWPGGCWIAYIPAVWA